MAGRPLRGRPAAGGALIALVGGDGAGKSTAVNALHAWLSPRFDTRTVHMGKPPRSIATLLIALARRMLEPLAKLMKLKTLTTLDRSAPQAQPSSRWDRGGSEGDEGPCRAGVLLMLRSVCLARDRFRAYARARRLASDGAVVLCDRYPVEQVKSMDGPNLGRLLAGGRKGWLAALCERAELRCYRRIAEPDLLIVLRVSPETAVLRKTDEESGYVRARNNDIWSVDWRGTRAVVVDAGRPSAEVLSELRALLWSVL
jgi:thymidylate kinase